MIRISRSLLFFMQFATLGLVAAFLYLYLYPVPDRNSAELLSTEFKFIEANLNQPLKTDHADAIALASPSVVQVFTQRNANDENQFHYDPFFEKFSGESSDGMTHTEPSLGSGVIISTDGYIVTNYHVIAEARLILISLHDGHKLQASIVGVDPESDLAVLKIDAHGLPAITLAHYNELKVGQIVMAIGNPFGVGQSATSGIISALGRHSLDISTYENFIQTDAAINPGNSGGALINSSGHLVGINTAIFTGSGGSQGIGFAIPIDLMKDVVNQIIMHGQVIRGWAGITIGQTPQEQTIVIDVVSGGPADEAGIQAYDVITHIEREHIASPRQLLFNISRHRPGETLKVTVLRNNTPTEIQLTVGQRPVQTTQ